MWDAPGGGNIEAAQGIAILFNVAGGPEEQWAGDVGQEIQMRARATIGERRSLIPAWRREIRITICERIVNGEMELALRRIIPILMYQ